MAITITAALISMPPYHRFSVPKQIPDVNGRCSIGQTKYSSKLLPPLVIPSSSSSASSTPTPIVEQKEEGSGSAPPSDSPLAQTESTPTRDSASLSSLRGCEACGREEIEKGCNGEGRIQGGIATVPGFGWWPIKAYRPCPGFVASGGRYRRSGQSMDEIASGRGENSRTSVRKGNEA